MMEGFYILALSDNILVKAVNIVGAIFAVLSTDRTKLDQGLRLFVCFYPFLKWLMQSNTVSDTILTVVH